MAGGAVGEPGVVGTVEATMLAPVTPRIRQAASNPGREVSRISK